MKKSEFKAAVPAVVCAGALFAANVYGADDLSWVDSAVARFGTNYTVLAENAKLGYTKEAPYPNWDYRAPDIPNEERDSSAAAVLGCGFLKLSKLCPDKVKAARYRAEAVAIAKSLSSDAYFAAPSEIGGFVLKHAVGSKPHKADIDVPLNYGDYYYLELLTELKR